MPLSSAINQYCSRPAGEAPRTAYVRPWALAAPILILLICIPLLRPLRHPDPRLMSDDEQSRLATVQAMVEGRTLAIENTDFAETRDKIAVGSHLYSSQPPMFAALLSGPYWVMHRMGLNLGRDSAWAAFWLTLLGVTLPVALSAGLVDRMGRLFELRRPLRAGLGLAVVAGSGLLSYGTVLNAHAPAAALLLAAVAFVPRNADQSKTHGCRMVGTFRSLRINGGLHRSAGRDLSRVAVACGSGIRMAAIEKNDGPRRLCFGGNGSDCCARDAGQAHHR